MFLHSSPSVPEPDMRAALDGTFLRPPHLRAFRPSALPGGAPRAAPGPGPAPGPALDAISAPSASVAAPALPASSMSASSMSAPAIPGRQAPRRAGSGGDRPRRDGLYRAGLKRALDVMAILLAAPIVAPLIAVLALLVWREGGRAFYVQERVGLNGRTYRMWKLRTMVPDADACLEACLKADPAMRAEWDSKQKLIDDPRITPLGRALRKCSADELPQLWNVLRGDMSLVGPRPMMVSQKPLYPGRDYYELRPGITGPWQISHRNESSFADRAKFDRLYNRKMSLRADLAILVATVRVVLRGTGH
jgi:lipopolysaccharide/colanic/teichoic acid biosynthesis glycosyltransferase